MHRFFLPNIDFKKTKISIVDQSEIHHLKNVLRMKTGQEISIFNGNGQEGIAKIISVNTDRIEIKIEEVLKVKENKFSISLACAIPKKSKFESIIEKTTELGVDEIIPLRTKRTEVVYTKEKLIKKTERFRTVAVNAAKQCKRSTIPTIHPVTDFSDLISGLKDNVAFIPCLEGKRKNIHNALKDIKPNKKILFIIGPEGDFTPEEINLAKKAGCIPLSLGDTVLKVDTAAISVVAFSNFFLQ